MERGCFRLLGMLMAGTLLLASAARGQSRSQIALTVDTTQSPLMILHVRETIPVQPGPLTIYYPKWIPGNHAPDGPIANLTGLKFEANGKTVPWRRDLLDVFTFHLDVPAGATELDASYDYLEPDGVSATDKLLVLEWNEVTLYLADKPAQQQIFAAKLILPEGWKYGTALPVESTMGDEVTFTPVELNRLVDSPVIEGQYYRDIDLTPAGDPIHDELDMVADSEAALAMPPAMQQEMKNLVVQAGLLFGARHYRDYHFLLTLSDHVRHFGLEHHESNDSRLPERTLLEPDGAFTVGRILPHEYVHSWNGKFRRPADLSTLYYEAPEETDLLWGYEGLTDYLGPMLAARSGLWTPVQYRDYLASLAAELGPGRPGRTWRPLLDTAVAEPGLGRARGWMNWRRGTDYYEEGDLMWLEVATIIHDSTHGRKSIDDFCHEFYGGPNLGPQLKTYTFDQLVAALNQVAPYGWAAFFHQRLNSTSPEPPVGGIENAGWKPVLNSEPMHLPGGPRMEQGDIYSVGLRLGPNGQVNDSIVGGPAYDAGVTSGMKVVGVNGHVYTHDVLEDAIAAAKDSTQPITLLVMDNDYYRTAEVNYHGGDRYPHLVREPSKPDYLDELIAARQ
ncbi:MAG: M61 family peptidase [Acidobacteriaceae bacterium]